MVQSFRTLLQPYLSLLRLDNAWNFFAPSVGKHSQFRYVIQDASGNEHTFVPTEESTSSVARYVWWREFKYLYEGVIESSQTRGNAAAALLCRKHAALQPFSVTLLEVQEQDFWPEDYLRDRRPLDPEFVTVNVLKRLRCRDGALLPRTPSIRPRRPS